MGWQGWFFGVVMMIFGGDYDGFEELIIFEVVMGIFGPVVMTTFGEMIGRWYLAGCNDSIWHAGMPIFPNHSTYVCNK